MIRFYFRAGSPETASALTSHIRADLDSGREVLLLVPEQETVSVERRMLELLPPSAQLSFEVVNFSRLANRTFRAVGGHSWNTASPAHRALLMWRTLGHLAPLLTQYGLHATEPRLCDLMLQTASRCKAYRVGSAELLRAADALPPDEPLRAKLSDIGTVLGVFEKELGEHFDNGDDELDRLEQLLCTKAAPLFASTHIYVDSFTDYTGQELAVLRALMRICPAVCFTFPLRSPHDSGLHLSKAERTYKHLARTAKELLLDIELCRAAEIRPANAREYVCEHLFTMNAMPAPLAFMQQPNVSIMACPTPFDEADAAVAQIQALVRGGCRYRDIAVVVRDTSAYKGILDAALEREGIPFYLSEKTDITVRPLIKLILLALRVHLHGWHDEDVVAYLKTGLCGVDPDDVNLFEEYIAVWHPRGEKSYTAPFTRNPDGYATARSARAERILCGANRAREALVPPLQALFSSLKETKTATDMCRALYAFLASLSITEALKAQAIARLSCGERREAEELSRLYQVTVDALETVAEALGDEPLDIPAFTEALRLVFARTDIGTIPTSADEVTVGSASMLRTDHPRFVLVLGLNEGEFPRTVGEDGLISDTEKERLCEVGLDLPSGRAERASDELFYVYRAFNAPREALYLFYCKLSASGKAAAPSIAIERVQKLLPMLKVRQMEALSPSSLIYSEGAALDRLGDLDAEEKQAVIELLREQKLPVARTLTLPVSDPDASVSEQTAGQLFDNTRFSPSHLESFASCRFAYYCSRILRLREEPTGSLALSDTGTFFHHVLEHTMNRVKQDGRPFSAWSELDIEALVDEVCTSYRRTLTEQGGDLTPRAESLLGRLTLLARLVVSSLFEEFSDSLFTPAMTELDLGRLGETPFVCPPQSKERIPLTGKADRVDIWQSPEGEVFLRVVDYKTGNRKFSPEDIAKGMSLQMPLYLRALTERAYPKLNHTLGLPDETVLRPAGVTYFSSAVSSEQTPSMVGRDKALQDAKQRLQRSGILLSEHGVPQAATLSGNPAIIGTPRSKKTIDGVEFDRLFDELGKTVSALTGDMKSGRATAAPNPKSDRPSCSYCPFGAICRVAKKD